MSFRSLIAFGLYVFFLTTSLGARAENANCPLCGMEFKTTARTAFDTEKEGKPVQLCSFACARKLRAKSPGSPLFAHDFVTDEKIPAEKAYYLTKSKAILKELDFDMPPSVVAFKKKLEAEAKKKSLSPDGKDGEIVHGFDALVKSHE